MYLFKKGSTWVARTHDDTHQGDGLTVELALAGLIENMERDPRLTKPPTLPPMLRGGQ